MSSADRDEVLDSLSLVGRELLDDDTLEALPQLLDDALAWGAVLELTAGGGSVSLRWPIKGKPAPVLLVYVDEWAGVELNLARTPTRRALADRIEHALRKALPQIGGTLGQRPRFSLDALALPDSQVALAEVFELIGSETIGNGERAGIADLPVVLWTIEELADLRSRVDASIVALMDHLADNPGRPMTIAELAPVMRRSPKSVPAFLGGLSSRTAARYHRRNWPFEAREGESGRWVYEMDAKAAEEWRLAASVVPRVDPSSGQPKGFSAGRTATNELRQEFFREVLVEVAKSQGFLVPAKASQNWVGFSSGRWGTWDISAATNHRLRIDAYIDSGDKGINKALFDEFNGERSVWEERVGFPLVWERLTDRRASRIAVYRPIDSFEPGRELEEASVWAVDSLNAMYTALNDRLRSRATQLR